MRYDTLGIHITNRCPLTCAHCITSSHPNARGDLTWSQIEAAVRTGAPYVNAVCVTGGEPMLLPDLSRATIALTRELGLRSSMVTSGFWARSKKGATRIVATLVEAGLDKLAVSFDEYHLVQTTAPYIGAETLDHLLFAATAAPLEVVVQYCGPKDHDSYDAATTAADRYGARFETSEVLPFGRGIQLARKRGADPTEVRDGPCGVVGRPILTPEQDLYTCCGPARGASADSPLRLPIGTAEDVGVALAQASVDPVINIIHTAGPRAMFDLLSPTARARVSGNLLSASMCALCRAITDDTDAVEELRAVLADRELRLVALSGVLHIAQDLNKEATQCL